MSGAALDCNDNNPCTDDLCDAFQGCKHFNNSSSCSDGNGCTTSDVCNTGVCVGGNTASGCSACQAVATIPTQGGTFVGQTSGSGTLTGSCASTGSSGERVYRWIPPTSGTATIQTCGNATLYDTVVYLRQGSCTGTQVACNDDTSGCGTGDGTATADHHGSKITPNVNAGQAYYIVVDGYGGKTGTYSLTVFPPTVCGNGVREGAEECDGTDNASCATHQCTAQCTCVPPAGGLPDLTPSIADLSVQRNTTVGSGDVAEGCAEATSGVDLLRFSVTTRNIGTADLFLGNPGCPTPCSSCPLCSCSNPDFICSPAQGHNHAHYTDYARYELLDNNNQAVVTGHKQGFCLLDYTCANPKYTCTNQGITAGCSDTYDSTLGCQYLDITGIPGGNYTLRVTADPFNRISELKENNNVATVAVTLTGGGATTTTIPGAGSCGNPIVVPGAGGTFTGTTGGASVLTAGCASQTGNAPEQVFRWTPTTSGTATIQTCGAGTTFDTVLSLRSGSCTSGTEVACNDDTTGCATGDSCSANNNHHGSVITPTVTAGQIYYVIVDGWSGSCGGSSGTFRLSITAP